LCIPKGVAWGTDGCPENAYKFFPLEIAINVYASSDSSSIIDGPIAPSSVTFTSLTTTSMRINWVDNSSDEDNFILEQASASGGPFTEIATPINNYYDNTGLTSGTRYYYRVAATNAIGTSIWAIGNQFTSSSSWVDSISYTTHFLEDFEDFPTTNVPTATAPVGVTLTDLQLYLDNFRDKQSDGGAYADENLAITMDIMDIEGSRASVHWYPIGMCCTGSITHENANGTNDNTGTGVHIECDMDNSPGRTLLIGWNEFEPDSFVISGGMKNSGLRNGFGTGYAMARTMTNVSQTESDLAFYTNAYYKGFSLPIERQTNTKSLYPEEWNTKGRWVHHALLCYLGTEGQYDGYMEAFRDGVMEDPTVWPPARRSSIPYLKTGDNTTWSIFSIETFMGGLGIEYVSTLTQFRIVDDLFAVSFDTPADYGYPHSPGDKIYLPTIANFPKTGGESDVPIAPSSVVFSSVTETAMRIGWTDNSSDEDNFILERSLSSGSGFTQIATPTTSYHDDSGLSSGVRYYYRVSATNAIGASTYATGSQFTSFGSWTDTVNHNVIYSEDFDDFPITNTHAAALPVGIPETDLELYWEGFEALSSDDANDPDLADNVDIVSIDGNNVIKSWYLIDQCCTGAYSDYWPIENGDEGWEGVIHGGTGVNVNFWFPSTRVIVQSYNIFIMAGFQNSDGWKNPGVGTDKGTTYSEASVRTMIVDSQTEFDVAIYHYNFRNGFYQPPEREANTKSLTPDIWFADNQWHNVTLYMDAGTELTQNGVVEVFIDGIKIDPTVWAPGHRSGIGYIDIGDNPGWKYGKFATFMGGEGNGYISPQTQWILYDDYVIYTLDSYPWVATPGEAIYIPAICNWPKE